MYVDEIMRLKENKFVDFKPCGIIIEEVTDLKTVPFNSEQ